MSPNWVAVARLDELTPGSSLEVTRDGRILALVRVEDRIFALAGLCPHQRARLAEGVVDVATKTITCPRRGCLRWRFDLATGTHAAGLPIVCPTYRVEVRAGVVFVACPD